MNYLTKVVSLFLRDEEALTMVEYALAGGLIALAVVGGFTAIGTSVDSATSDISDSF